MEQTKRCPYCGEEIMATAKKCKHCGEWLSTDAQKQVQKKIEPEKPIAHEGESVWEKILYYLLIGAIYLWWVPILLIIAAFTVPSEEKHLKKIEEDVIDCIQDKSNDVLDAVGLSSLSGWASLFINANVSQQAILVAFNQQNDIEVEKHWFWSNGKIYNRIYPYGKNISFGIFGFVIPYVDWDDIALLPMDDEESDNYGEQSSINQSEFTHELFAGDVGGYPCHFDLRFNYSNDDDDLEVSGSYYYDKQGSNKNILLQGIYDSIKGYIYLYEYLDNGDVNATFRGKRYGDEIIGSFEMENGKEMEFHMNKIN